MLAVSGNSDFVQGKGRAVFCEDRGVFTVKIGIVAVRVSVFRVLNKSFGTIPQSVFWYMMFLLISVLDAFHQRTELRSNEKQTKGEQMIYKNIYEGEFVSRHNRFIARVLVDGVDTAVHVKNTGRMRELLIPGARVILNKSDNPARKTAYDLTGVYKDGKLFNIDSQAPNKVVKEWLGQQDFDLVRPEYTYGDSRVDFYMEKGSDKYLMEVKGCTLEIDGIGYFPDAPTQRGVKHIRELIRAKKEGYHAALAFVIQMEGVTEVRPNNLTMPEFGEAVEEAKQAGVDILYLQTKVEPCRLQISAEGKLSAYK